MLKLKKVNMAILPTIVNLNEIWEDEPDFSNWLSEEENLKELSNLVGINMTLNKREFAVGSFRGDIFATEEGTGKKIIIENQFNKTDHDHLGKIITYAAGKAANIIIWIAEDARDEHMQAIEWLNQQTKEEISFFLIEIVVWKYNNSLPSLEFRIIEKPYYWVMNRRTWKISDITTKGNNINE